MLFIMVLSGNSCDIASREGGRWCAGFLLTLAPLISASAPTLRQYGIWAIIVIPLVERSEAAMDIMRSMYSRVYP